MEIFILTIETRDKHHNPIYCREDFNRSFLTNTKLECHKENVESHLKEIARTLKAWMPTNYISVKASYRNSIANTVEAVVEARIEPDSFDIQIFKL